MNGGGHIDALSRLALQQQPAQVDLWVAEPGILDDGQRVSAYLELCNQQERERYERIVHLPTQRNHLLARAMVRTILSRYQDVTPTDWRFVTNQYDCPFIDPSQNTLDLRFNLSHATGLVVLGVTRGRQLGVDVEWSPRRLKVEEVADSFFAAPEVRAFHRLPAHQQRERFFAYWTLKESYIKARSMGLSIPLKKFWFDVETVGEIHFDLDPVLADDPRSWTFLRMTASRSHPLAVAVRCCPSTPLQLRVFRCVPLEGAEEVTLKTVARTKIRRLNPPRG